MSWIPLQQKKPCSSYSHAINAFCVNYIFCVSDFIVCSPDVIIRCGEVAESALLTQEGHVPVGEVLLCEGGLMLCGSCHTNCHARMKCREGILSGTEGRVKRRENITAQSTLHSETPPPPYSRSLGGVIIVNHLITEAAVNPRFWARWKVSRWAPETPSRQRIKAGALRWSRANGALIPWRTKTRRPSDRWQSLIALFNRYLWPVAQPGSRASPRAAVLFFARAGRCTSLTLVSWEGLPKYVVSERVPVSGCFWTQNCNYSWNSALHAGFRIVHNADTCIHCCFFSFIFFSFLILFPPLLAIQVTQEGKMPVFWMIGPLWSRISMRFWIDIYNPQMTTFLLPTPAGSSFWLDKIILITPALACTAKFGQKGHLEHYDHVACQTLACLADVSMLLGGVRSNCCSPWIQIHIDI